MAGPSTATPGTGQSQDATGQAKEKAQEIAGQAREQAGQAAGQARDRMRSELDRRSTQAGERVSTTGGDLRSVADSLRSHGKDQPARLAEQAAERVEHVGGYLQRSDADALLTDIEDFARRRPWAIGLGAAVLGFAGARLLKASSVQRYESREGERAQLPRTTTPRSSATGTYAPAPTPGTYAGAPATGTYAGSAGIDAPPTAHPTEPPVPPRGPGAL